MDNNQEIYDSLDNFIANNSPVNKINDAISIIDLHSGKELYNKIKNTYKPHYEIFGSNGMGYTCFSIYKNIEDTIYLFVINIQTPIYYIKIENETFFE
jgi:hypothetical protein